MSAGPGAGGGDTPEDIVFVGGTGRSGTHIVARLLGHHPRYADVPIEARFHCNKRGMPDLLEGRVSLDGFLDKLRSFWWHRVRVDAEPRGLYNMMRRRPFDEAVERFRGSFHADPVGACRALFCDLLGPWAAEQRKPGLVEMSSRNVRAAHTLRRMFAGARFVHTVRDGRDAASSVATKTWGPDNVVDAIDWWADRLRAIETGIRAEDDGSRFVVAPERFRVVVLDELVGGDREGAYAALLEPLGIDDDPAMRAFFEREMSAEDAHLGRWREGLGALGRARVERKYEKTLAALERERNHVAPALIRARERLG